MSRNPNAPGLRIVLRDAAAARWMIFSDPVDILVARDPGEVAAVLEAASGRVSGDGLFAAGFLGYEAAAAFDPAYVTHPPGKVPVACFGLYRAPQVVDSLPPAKDAGRPAWHIGVDAGRYREHIDAIRAEIARGNTYQVNYTVRQHARGIGDPWALFLRIAADAPYAAYVESPEYAVVSASPELFFELSGDRLVCRPMKGTAARGMTTPEDDRRRGFLRHSAKDRAENVMIADMVRNDLGRIAVPGSVQSERLFEIEKHRTVWQMTSTITARTSVPMPEIFRALFPSASITGAPKVASMRLIAALEGSPREVYTGCIGFLAPARRARFNVAIRTAIVDRQGGTAVYGVGGGIVWDSRAADEYRECLDKAAVLDSAADGGSFELLETLLWRRGEGLVLEREHLDRLADSARYFDFTCDPARIEDTLRSFAARLAATSRIRLRLRRDGALTLDAREQAECEGDAIVRLGMARRPVDLRDPFLYHKTTRRTVYERALAEAGDCDDVLLWNGSGEITESSIANVVVRIGGRLYTPPPECGLLAGTMRRGLLEEGTVAERVVRIDELPRVEALYLVNSVRGWRRAVIDERSTAAG